MARLDKLEADIAQIKKLLVSKQTVQIEPKPAQIIKPTEKIPEKTPVKKEKVSLESVIGTKWLGRVGMIAVIFGIAFFLKYSFDNDLIGETGRIILGIISGVCFIAAGEYFQNRKNWPVYGQILTGGGLAILYFSIYAAFSFYHLISQLPGFAAFVVITTTGIILSVRYNAVSIAAIGMLGGFLTPEFLSTGENKPLALFSYILLLDTGILTVVYFKNWRSLAIASLAGTMIIYDAWHKTFYTIDQQAASFGITTVVFLFYNLFVFLSNFLKEQKTLHIEQAIVFLAALFYLLSFYEQNHQVNDWNLKSFVLAVAVIEIIFAALSLRSDAASKLIPFSFTDISIIFSVISVFAVFEKEWISAALATEMAVFGYIGIKLDKPLLRLAAYVLGALSLLRFVGELEVFYGPFEKFTILLNGRFLVCSFIIAAFYALFIMLSKNQEHLLKKNNELLVIPATLVITQVLSVILISMEYYDFYRYRGFVEFKYARQLSLSIIWTLYAFAMIGIGIIRKAALLRILGILLTGIAVSKVFLFDLSELRTISRIVSFVVLGLILLTVSFFYNRFKHRIFGEETRD